MELKQKKRIAHLNTISRSCYSLITGLGLLIPVAFFIFNTFNQILDAYAPAFSIQNLNVTNRQISNWRN